MCLTEKKMYIACGGDFVRLCLCMCMYVCVSGGGGMEIFRSLTRYHTMPHFDALKIYSCGKHWEKRRDCL